MDKNIDAIQMSTSNTIAPATEDKKKEGVASLVAAYNVVLELLNKGEMVNASLGNTLYHIQNTQIDNTKTFIDKKAKLMEKNQKVHTATQILIGIGVVLAFGASLFVTAGTSGATLPGILVGCQSGASFVGGAAIASGGSLQIYSGVLSKKLSKVEATTAKLKGNSTQMEQIGQFTRDKMSDEMGLQSTGNRTLVEDMGGLASAMQQAAQQAALGIKNQ